MIGQRIVAQPRMLVTTVLACLGFATLLAGVISGKTDFGIGAIMPLALALVQFLARDRPFAVRFTDVGIEIENPPVTILYSDLQGLRAVGRPADPYKVGPRHYPIYIVHRKGRVRIPARLDVPSDEVYQFLLRQFQSEDARPIDSRLEAYRRRKEARYSAAHIWCYQARSYLGHGAETSRVQVWMAGFFLGGLVWMIYGLQWSIGLWSGLGTLSMVLGGLFWFLAAVIGRELGRNVGNWHLSSLVICPDGLGLIQGELKGQLNWRELKKVKFVSQLGGQSIVLILDGVEIQIADIYNRPLALIYQHIRYYWRSEEDFEPVERAPVFELRAGSTGVTPGYLPDLGRRDARHRPARDD